MLIIHDQSTDTIYIQMKESIVSEPTHQYEKFDVNLYWDGHGEMVGILFKNVSKNGSIELKEMVWTT